MWVVGPTAATRAEMEVAMEAVQAACWGKDLVAQMEAVDPEAVAERVEVGKAVRRRWEP